MYRLIVPQRFVNIFKDRANLNEEISEIAGINITIANNRQYHITSQLMLLNGLLFEEINKSFPESWFFEIPPPVTSQFENIMGSFLFDTTSRAIVIRKASGSKIILKHKTSYLEIDSNMGKSCYDLSERLMHIIKHENFTSISVIDILPNIIDNTEYFIPIYRYFIYDSNWLETNGSTGGGNITSSLSEEQLARRLHSGEVATLVGDTNYRISEKFEQLISEVNDEN